MSAGCVHQKASILLAGGFLVGSFFYGESGVEYAIGALVGILLTPDLDVDNGYIGNSIIRGGLGYWADKGWDVLWYFYRRSIKHGSELSHFPVISTMFRLIYLFLFLYVLPHFGLALFVPGEAGNPKLEILWWLGLVWQYREVIAGLMGSDLIHYVLDTLTTEHAQNKKTTIFGLPLASSSCK